MDYFFFILSVICVWTILSLGTNLVIGYGGLMTLGHVGYLAIGAYTAATLNILLHVNFYLTIPIAILVTAAVAYLTIVPLLRLGAFFFGLATLGFNIVVTDVLQNIGPRNPGAEGLFGLNLPALMTIGGWRFAIIAAFTLAALLLARLLVGSPFGRSLRAMRDEPDAIESLGKSAKQYRLIVWTISGALAGLAGALYCTTLSYIDPTVFNFLFSFNLLVYIGFGGLASILGSILGPAILIAFGESLRFSGLPSEITGPVQQSLFALLLIFVMMFRRQGLVGKYDFLGNKLEYRDLYKHFEGLQVFKDVTFDVPAGKITALIGPNGAGKSTLINMTCGVFPQDGGTIFKDGNEIRGLKGHGARRLSLARTFQNVRVFPTLTVLENVMVGFPDQPGENPWRLFDRSAKIAEARNREAALQLLERVGLSADAERRADAIPFGSQKLLALVRATATGADTLLLDETTTGLEISRVPLVLDFLRALRSEGRTVLLVEHNMDVVTDVADCVVVLHGTVIAQGTPQHVLHDEQVIRDYLGRIYSA